MTPDPNSREYWAELIRAGGASAAISRARELAPTRTAASGAIMVYTEGRSEFADDAAALYLNHLLLTWQTGARSTGAQDVTVTTDAAETRPSADYRVIVAA